MPRTNFHVAERKSRPTTSQDLHLTGNFLRGFIRRVKGSESFLAYDTIKPNLMRQNLMHGLCRSKRLLPEAYGILQHTLRHQFQRHNAVLFCEASAANIVCFANMVGSTRFSTLPYSPPNTTLWRLHVEMYGCLSRPP